MMSLKEIIDRADDDSVKNTLISKIHDCLRNYSSELEPLLVDKNDFNQFLKDLATNEITVLKEESKYRVSEYIEFTDFMYSIIGYKINEGCFYIRSKIGSNKLNRKEVFKKIKSFMEKKEYFYFSNKVKYDEYITNDSDEFEIISKNKIIFLRTILDIFSPFCELQQTLHLNLVYDNHRDDFRMDLINSWGLEICPYCNESLIKELKSQSATTAELDHLLPKSYFPLFSLSYGNFITSCTDCNKKFKTDNVNTFIYNRQEGFGNDAIFNYSNLSLESYLDPNVNQIDLDFEIKNLDRENEIKRFIEDFGLITTYGHDNPKTEVCSMFRTVKRICNRGNKKIIESLTSGIDVHQEIIKYIQEKDLDIDEQQEIYDQYSETDKWNNINKRFGKCKTEIYERIIDKANF